MSHTGSKKNREQSENAACERRPIASYSAKPFWRDAANDAARRMEFPTSFHMPIHRCKYEAFVKRFRPALVQVWQRGRLLRHEIAACGRLRCTSLPWSLRRRRQGCVCLPASERLVFEMRPVDFASAVARALVFAGERFGDVLEYERRAAH